MIRRIAALSLLVSIAAAASAEEIRGSWTADATDMLAGRIHLQMSRRHSNFGQSVDVSSLSGLSEAQINAASQTAVRFAIRREPGTFDFEGTFKGGLGAGQFSFTPNPAYLDAVRTLGVSTEQNAKRSAKPADERLMHLALHDVSTGFIRSMMAAGYRVSLEDYVSFRIFDVTADLVRELRSLGYADLSARDLVASRIHGVTPEFIREMRAAGYGDASLRQLVEFRIHDITPEYVRALREAGYDRIPARKLVQMKIHGVDAEFVKKMNGM